METITKLPYTREAPAGNFSSRQLVTLARVLTRHDHHPAMIAWARGGWCIGCEMQMRLAIDRAIAQRAAQAHAEIRASAAHARRCIGQRYRRAVEAISKGKS